MTGVLLLLLGTGLMAGGGCGGEERLERAAVPGRAIIRVDAQYLITASDIKLTCRLEDDDPVELVLHFAVDRAELLKLKPPHFGLELDSVTMLKLDPGLPVFIEATAKPELLEKLDELMDDKKKLVDLLAVTGDNGFPMLLDLENYSARGWVQEVK